MCDALKQELETFEKHLPELLADNEGKFVLIKGEDVVDIYESRDDAIKIGYERFGDVPFLTKRISKTEEPIHFTHTLFS